MKDVQLRKLEESYEISLLFSHLRNYLWIRLNPSLASGRKRLGIRGGTVVSPNLDFVVRSARPGRSVPLGL